MTTAKELQRETPSLLIQNSTLSRHQVSHDPCLSVQKLELQANMQNAYKKAETKNVELQSEKLENYIKQMSLVYCMTKNDIAASNFQDLTHVQVLNGVT